MDCERVFFRRNSSFLTFIGIEVEGGMSTLTTLYLAV